MAVTNGPQIAISQIHAEVGGTGQASLNDADIRGLINKASGAQMAMSEWYGASAAIQFVTSALRNSTGASGVRSLSLTGLGIQTGDLVVVASIAQGIGNKWFAPITSGWSQCDGNQGYVNWQTSYRYYKKMGATVDSTFQISTSETSSEFYNHPAIVVVFRNTGSSPTNSSATNTTLQQSVYVPGSQTVSNSGSLHIIVATRAANKVANAVSGWTQISNGYSSIQFGTTYYNRAHLWYKLGVGSGSSNIGTLSFPSSFARCNGSQLIFN